MKVVYKASHHKERAKAFFAFHLSCRNKIKYVYYGMALILLVAGILLYMKRSQSGGIILVSGSVFTLILRPILIDKMAKRSAEQVSSLIPESHIIFTETDITYLQDTLTIHYEWDKLIHVAETLNYYFFYVKENGALMIVKDVLSFQESKDLKALIQNKIIDGRYKKYKRK